MKLLLIRHGETKEGKNNIILGHLPGKLTKKGKEFAKQVAKTIKKSDINPSLIISSDLFRAKNTATIISKILELPIEYEKLLRERSAGKSEGKSEKEINWKEYEKKTKLYRSHPEGESFIEVKNRAKKFLHKIKDVRHKTIIIVSHNVFLSMLISEFFKRSIEKCLKYSFDKKITIINTRKKSGVENIPLPIKRTSSGRKK